MIAASLTRYTAPAFAVVIAVLISAGTAFGADQVHDEIQVYNAEIASVGQWTYQQHLNYAAIGQTQPKCREVFHQIMPFKARRNSPMA